MTSIVEPEFSHSVDLLAGPVKGKKFHLAADEETCAKVASRLGIPAVKNLEGDLALHVSRTEINVKGVLKATLIRECVASLEEMTETIDEEFDTMFLRQGGDSARFKETDEESWDGEEVPPEIHDADSFDLGEFLVQQLALAMEAFPRKPGAASLTDSYGGADNVSPFAILREKVEKPDENQ